MGLFDRRQIEISAVESRRSLLVGGHGLVHHDSDRRGAIMKRNEPSPATPV